MMVEVYYERDPKTGEMIKKSRPASTFSNWASGVKKEGEPVKKFSGGGNINIVP